MKNVLELNFQLTNTKIVFCYSEKAYKNYIKGNYNLYKTLDGNDGICSVLTKNGIINIVVGVRKNKNIYELKSTIVHELSHITTKYMEYFGINDDEFRSYMLSWLYEEIIYFLDTKIIRKFV